MADKKKQMDEQNAPAVLVQEDSEETIDDLRIEPERFGDQYVRFADRNGIDERLYQGI